MDACYWRRAIWYLQVHQTMCGFACALFLSLKGQCVSFEACLRLWTLKAAWKELRVVPPHSVRSVWGGFRHLKAVLPALSAHAGHQVTTQKALYHFSAVELTSGKSLGLIFSFMKKSTWFLGWQQDHFGQQMRSMPSVIGDLLCAEIHLQTGL